MVWRSFNPPAAGGILTFHPVRLQLGGVSAEALPDALNPWGGCFFVMTGHFLAAKTDRVDGDVFFAGLDRIELEWGRYPETWKLPCRVAGYSLDQEGLVAYLVLRFLDSDPAARRAFENFMASLW